MIYYEWLPHVDGEENILRCILHPQSLTFFSIYRSILIASIRVHFLHILFYFFHTLFYQFDNLLANDTKETIDKIRTCNSFTSYFTFTSTAVNTSSHTYLIMSCNWLWLNHQFCKVNHVENIAVRWEFVRWFFESSQ